MNLYGKTGTTKHLKLLKFVDNLSLGIVVSVEAGFMFMDAKQ